MGGQWKTLNVMSSPNEWLGSIPSSSYAIWFCGLLVLGFTAPLEFRFQFVHLGFSSVGACPLVVERDDVLVRGWIVPPELTTLPPDV